MGFYFLMEFKTFTFKMSPLPQSDASTQQNIFTESKHKYIQLKILN